MNIIGQIKLIEYKYRQQSFNTKLNEHILNKL